VYVHVIILFTGYCKKEIWKLQVVIGNHPKNFKADQSASAAIVVSKRSYFFDLFSDDKLKHYISPFSIIWSAAPILPLRCRFLPLPCF
jgi:hypothetical protein